MIYNNCVTQEELEIFRRLKNIKVVFDIGAKDNIEYLEIKPNAEFHLFEPVPKSVATLRNKVKEGEWKKVFINEFGIGDVDGALSFNTASESFEGSVCTPGNQGPFTLPIRTLDGYIEEHKIKRIDFIKIDAEGMDLNIIKSNPKAIKMARYLQFECWDNRQDFIHFLNEFTCEDIGGRNVFCTRK